MILRFFAKDKVIINSNGKIGKVIKPYKFNRYYYIVESYCVREEKLKQYIVFCMDMTLIKREQIIFNENRKIYRL